MNNYSGSQNFKKTNMRVSHDNINIGSKLIKLDEGDNTRNT